MPTHEEFTVRSRRDGAAHLLELSGELDLATCSEVERELQRVETTDVERIVLDLGAVTFMDSTGIQLLLDSHARNDGAAGPGRLRVRGAHGPVAQVLRITGVDTLLVSDG